jgi:hypothetical protein
MRPTASGLVKSKMPLAVEEITIVELAPLAAAPMAGRLLADPGADVIQVEQPVRGDSWRGLMAVQRDSSNVNRNWENYSLKGRDLFLPTIRKYRRNILLTKNDCPNRAFFKCGNCLNVLMAACPFNRPIKSKIAIFGGTITTRWTWSFCTFISTTSAPEYPHIAWIPS